MKVETLLTQGSEITDGHNEKNTLLQFCRLSQLKLGVLQNGYINLRTAEMLRTRPYWVISYEWVDSEWVPADDTFLTDVISRVCNGNDYRYRYRGNGCWISVTVMALHYRGNTVMGYYYIYSWRSRLVLIKRTKYHAITSLHNPPTLT